MYVGNDYVFIYDIVVINSGYVYNNYSGIFIVLFSGLYVFVYLIVVVGYYIFGDYDLNFGEIFVRLVCNVLLVGFIVVDIELVSEDEMVIGFVILYLDVGDIVKVVNLLKG